MNLDHIRERFSRGFRPFALGLTNGRKFEVPHPDFIAVGRNVIICFGKNNLATKIDALHIVSAEDLRPRKKK